MLAACPLLALFLQQKALHCRSGDDKEMSSVISKASKRSPVSSSGGGLLKHGWRKETAVRGAGSCCRALPAASRAPLARPRPGLPKPLQLQLPEGAGARVGSAAKRRAHDGHCPTHTGQNLKRTATHEAREAHNATPKGTLCILSAMGVAVRAAWVSPKPRTAQQGARRALQVRAEKLLESFGIRAKDLPTEG